MSIESFIYGHGIIVGARSNWVELPSTQDACFVDTCTVSRIRNDNPGLQSAVLAPVDVVDRSGLLKFANDQSVDYVVDWAAAYDGALNFRRIKALARVLRPGGAALLPVRRCADTLLGEYVSRIEAVLLSSPVQLEFGMVVRRGALDVAVLRRSSDLRGRCAIVSCGDHIYASDGAALRHITSLSAFERLRNAGLHSLNISEAERDLFIEGATLSDGGVSAFLAAMEMNT